MLIGLVLAVALAAQTQAPGFKPEIWPEMLGEWDRLAAAPLVIEDPVLREYGLEAAERADYFIGQKKMVATGYRFREAQGGVAGYLTLRPPDARPVTYDDEGVKSGKTVVVRFGNYVFRFDGDEPAYPVYEQLLAYVPMLDQAPPAPARAALPPKPIANSERAVAGPDSLAKFFPGVPPSLVAFRLGAEGFVAQYSRGPLAIFGYPDNDTAATRCREFRKLSGASVKCTGPLVAVSFVPGLVDAVTYSPPPAEANRPAPPPSTWPFWLAVGLVVLAGLGLSWWLRRRVEAPAGHGPALADR